MEKLSINRLYTRTTLLYLAVGVAIIFLLVLYFIRVDTVYPFAAMAVAILILTCGIGLINALMPSSHQDVGLLEEALNHLEKKYQKQVQKRAREQDRLDTVIHTMTDGVIMLSRSGKVRLINPAALQLLEYTEEGIRRKRFSQVAHDPHMIEIWENCYQNNRNEIAMIEVTSRDGSQERFLRMVVTSFLHREDRGYLIILQDLTRLQRLQTVRRDFVSNVSHELRTPVASLKALVETLHDSALDDPPAARHFLQRMEIEVDALTGMVQELFELSRIESDEMSLDLQPVSPIEILRHSADRLAPQANRAQVKLTIDLPADLPEILADSVRIQQVVTNLVHNAIKFTPSTGRVMVSATVAHSGQIAVDHDTLDYNIEHSRVDEEDILPQIVTVRVADTGVGIPAKDLPRIFERFYKTDRARAGGGTGLGLAICKHIVQAHNGQIWAESVEGQGSTFSFSLPVI